MSTDSEASAGTMNGGRLYPCGKARRSGVTLRAPLSTERSRMFSREAWARRIQRGQVLRQTVSGAKQPQRKRRKLPEGDVEPTAAAPMESPPCLDPGQCLTSGDVIKYRRPPWREPIPPTALDVLYEDEHILVVHKPSGLPCMPSQIFESFTVLNILRYSEEPMAQHLGGVNQSPRNPSTTKSERLPLQPVHRLGVGTSGALICAKTRVARRRLSADIRQRRSKGVSRPGHWRKQDS